MVNPLYIILINSVIILSSTFFIVYSLFNPTFLKGNNIDEYTNNYCQENPSSIICKNKFKKNKFIWIFVDGNAYDELFLLRKNQSQFKIQKIFRGKGKGFKHTNPLFTEMFSGVTSYNMLCKPINRDQIFKQLHKAGYKMNFLGWTEPVNNLNGKTSDIFIKRHLTVGHDKCSFCCFCNKTYPIDDNWCKDYYKKITDDDQRILDLNLRENLYNDLDKHFKKDQTDILKNINISDCLHKSTGWENGENFVYYNTEVDAYNHFYAKNHIRTITEEYNTENWIIKLMEWIDEHPEYALIVNGDHGGQNFYGEDFVNNHGLDIDGNEAITFIYTKELRELFDEEYSKKQQFYVKVDPSSIISQIFENVNIPLQSEGIAYPLGKDPLLRYIAYKSKEVQLIKQMETYIKKYPSYNNDLKQVISKVQNSKYSQVKEEEYPSYYNDDQFSEDSIKFIKTIQNEITSLLEYKNYFMNFSIFIIFCIIYLCSTIYLLIFLYKTIKDKNGEENNQISLSLYILLLSFSLFLSTIFNFLFIPIEIPNRLILGIILTPFTTFICFYIIEKINTNAKNRENNILSNIIIIFLALIGLILYYTKSFLHLKKLFSKTFNCRICNIFIIYPIFYVELYYEVKRNFKKEENILLFNFSLYKIMLTVISSFIGFLFLYDMTYENYFTEHSLINYIATLAIYMILIILIIISLLIINIKKRNNLLNNFGLIKLIFLIFQVFLNDEADRLLLVILFYPLLEYFTNFYYQKQDILSKILISVLIVHVGELFFILTKNTFSMGTSNKIISRTFMFNDKIRAIGEVLRIIGKLKHPLIVATYFLHMTPIYKNILLLYEDSMIFRMIHYIRCNMKLLLFAFHFVVLKNNEDFMTLMMYFAVELALFIFDFFGIIVHLVGTFRENMSIDLNIKENREKLTEDTERLIKKKSNYIGKK